MAYLMLYGSGWTQRWRLAEGFEADAADAITRVGRPESTQLRVVDPGSGTDATLVVAWGQVAAAIILDSDAGPPHDDSGGQYV